MLIGHASSKQHHQSLRPEKDIGANKVDRARRSVHLSTAYSLQPGFPARGSKQVRVCGFQWRESRMKLVNANRLDRNPGGWQPSFWLQANPPAWEKQNCFALGESTVLGPTIENVRRAAVKEIVLVLGASEEAIPRRLPASLLQGLKVVVNPLYEQGMASSLRAGLSALDPQTDAALIVLADQPFVRPETLDQLGR